MCCNSMYNFLLITAKQHVANGEVRCLRCSHWFKPNGMCATRCHDCMKDFFVGAKKSGIINPLCNPAWPGMESAANSQYMPNA